MMQDAAKRSDGNFHACEVIAYVEHDCLPRIQVRFQNGDIEYLAYDAWKSGGILFGSPIPVPTGVEIDAVKVSRNIWSEYLFQSKSAEPQHHLDCLNRELLDEWRRYYWACAIADEKSKAERLAFMATATPDQKRLREIAEEIDSLNYYIRYPRDRERDLNAERRSIEAQLAAAQVPA